MQKRGAEMEFHEVSNLFPLMEGDEYRALVDDIRANGLREPIWTYQGRIIDGRNRWRACQELGIEPKTQEWDGNGSLVQFVVSLNLHRRHLTPSQRAAVAVEMLPMLEREARERRLATLKQNASVTAILPERRGEARQIAASVVGVGARYVSDAKRIKTDAPALLEHVKSGAITLQDAKKVVALPDDKRAVVVNKLLSGEAKSVKQAKVQVQAAALNAEPPPLPTGPFRVIVADPPWEYEKRAEDPTHRASLPYPSMTVEEIKALPVRNLAADDAILWLWTTNAHMRQAYDVIEAWGFEAKTILTWVKDRMGTGDWLRGQTEHCIMAVRGEPVVTLTNQTTALFGPLREHSRKPEEFYALVESLCPGSKVELFARAPRRGWAAHGDEIDRFSSIA